MYLFQQISNWLSSFFFGKVVRIECEYCSYLLGESDIDQFEDEDDLMVAVLEHPCHVKSRRQLAMISQRFGFWEDSYIISKSLWETQS